MMTMKELDQIAYVLCELYSVSMLGRSVARWALDDGLITAEEYSALFGSK